MYEGQLRAYILCAIGVGPAHEVVAVSVYLRVDHEKSHRNLLCNNVAHALNMSGEII